MTMSNLQAESINEVRRVLQAFQDGYTTRDTAQLPEFMGLFVDDDDLEVIGTGATREGEGEWCLGPEAVRSLIESDWKYWGDLRIDVAGARIHVRGNVAWVATRGTVTDRIPEGPAYRSYLSYVTEVLEQDQSPKLKLLELVRTGTHALYELEQGEEFVWPLRLTAILVRHAEGWRFHRMQFSYPTTRYPDVRLPPSPDA